MVRCFLEAAAASSSSATETLEALVRILEVTLGTMEEEARRVEDVGASSALSSSAAEEKEIVVDEGSSVTLSLVVVAETSAQFLGFEMM